MKKLLLLISIISFQNIFSQTIPVSRTADWTIAGYRDSIPSPVIVFDVTDFGAAGDSITDNSSAIQNAIDSLHGSSGVIYFPSGFFLVGSTIDLPDSVVIRGRSSDSTVIAFNLNGAAGNGFNISGSPGGSFTSLQSGILKGSNYLIVSDTTFHAGDYAELLENNGAWDTQPVSWADNSVGQILHISSISGDTLYFDTTIRIDYDSLLNPRIRKIIPATETGIECLQIQRLDSVPAGVCFNIYFNYAANCWVRGVESSKSVGSHIEADASTNISITGCYIHHSYAYDGVSTHGYGITLFAHTGQCLIENNIMRHLRHSFSMQTGANGNVISYNYSIDPNRSEVPANAGADISLHGHYPFANLFEGNIVQNIQIDQTHGPSGPFNTFFRNKAELYGLVMTSATAQSDSQNFVGNDIPNINLFMGNYTLAGSGHFEFGNNVRNVVTPTGTTNLPDSSYYLNGLPTFWSLPDFPSIGVPNLTATGSNPARDRYLSGANFTMCDEGIISSINSVEKLNATVFPNPTSGNVQVHLQNFKSNHFIVTLKNLSGQNLFTINKMEIDFNFSFPKFIPNGIYLLEISSDESRVINKLILNR